MQNKKKGIVVNDPRAFKKEYNMFRLKVVKTEMIQSKTTKRARQTIIFLCLSGLRNKQVSKSQDFSEKRNVLVRYKKLFQAQNIPS